MIEQGIKLESFRLQEYDSGNIKQVLTTRIWIRKYKTGLDYKNMNKEI